MKKLCMMLLAIVMVLVLVACGNNNETNNPTLQNGESSSQQTTESVSTTEENVENVTLFVGIWTDGNTTLTVNADGSCNLFVKEGYVMGEAQKNISKDYVWEVDDSGNLLTIDEAEGGYNTWIRIEIDGKISLEREGSSEILIFEN